MPEDRPARPARPADRPSFPARPFRPGLRPDTGPPPPHSVRIRDGERELEVTGSPVFVRQVLDDLHNIWSQLRGDAPRQPASIRMPSPPRSTATDEAPPPDGGDEGAG